MKKLSVLCLPALVFGLAGIANSALIDRGGGLIYDSDQDITWLQDANYAQTMGYDADGRMNWNNAVAWADGLEYYDSVRDVIWTDWRLPTTVDGPYVWGYDGTTTGGHNIITSEMGYMYYVNLGNLSSYATDGTNPQLGWGLVNTDPFINLQAFDYWSGTEYSAYIYSAWNFTFLYGAHVEDSKDVNYYAWAVMDGDVVPIPSAVWLLGSGLIAFAGMRHRKKFKSRKQLFN